MDQIKQADQQIYQQPAKATGANQYLQPYKSKKAIIFDNFLGGLSWSFGSFLGLAIITVIAGYVISQIDLIPLIGSWITAILEDATSRIQPPIPQP